MVMAQIGYRGFGASTSDKTLLIILAALALIPLAMPAGILGAGLGLGNAISKIFSKIWSGVSTPGGLLGAGSLTDPIGNLNVAISTPGGLLGAQSLTDIPYQLENIFSGIKIHW